MDGVQACFAEMLYEMRYIIPNISEWDVSEPKSACRLTMEAVKWPNNGNIASIGIKSDFACVHVTDINNFPLTLTLLMDNFMSLFNKINYTSFAKDLEVEITTCMMYMKRAGRYGLDDGHTNEAFVRMMYANPIVFKLCAMHGYWFRVEDRMYTVSDLDEGVLENAITERSTADYVCFHMHEGRRLAAVLLETKTERSFKMNSIAQLVGYYLRSPSITLMPAVCIILSEKTLSVVLFLFVDGHMNSLVNAVLLKSIHYRNNLLAALALLTIIIHKDFKYAVLLQGFELFPKGYQFVVKTSLDETLEDLRAKLKKKDEKIQEIEIKYSMVQEELLKLQCLVTIWHRSDATSHS